MNNWLESFAYRINIGWLVFAVAAAISVHCRNMHGELSNRKKR